MIYLKSEKEIDFLRAAGEVVFRALTKIEEIISPGITTIELDRIAEETIRSFSAIPSFKGYEGPAGVGPFPGSICSSVNGEVVHGIPSDIVLNEGDIISIDVGAYLDGYHGDAARTFPVGKVSDEASKLIEVAKQSFFDGIANAIPGNRIGDISKAVQNCVEMNGFSVVRDFVGHGIGRELHEEPQIPNYASVRRGPRIAKGMTLAIEPMINVGDYRVRILENGWTVATKDGSLSAHYENSIAVTDNEPQILTMVI